MTDYVTAELVPAGSGPRAVATPTTPLREQLLRLWLLSRSSPATREAYGRDVTAYFAWCDEFEIDALASRRFHVDAYREFLQNGGAGRTYSKATRARKLAALSSFFTYAMQEAEDIVLRNPADPKLVKRPKGPKAATPWLTVDELQRLFAAADEIGLWEAALVRVLYYSAVRVTELCTATTASLRTIDGVLTFSVDRKGGAEDRVEIGEPAAVALRRHLAGRTGPLFLLKGRAIDRHQVAYAITRIARAAGLADKKLTPHGLRHSAATNALQDGENPIKVQAMLGHARIETTMIYNHTKFGARESTTHRLARLVEGAEDPDDAKRSAL